MVSEFLMEIIILHVSLAVSGKMGELFGIARNGMLVADIASSASTFRPTLRGGLKRRSPATAAWNYTSGWCWRWGDLHRLHNKPLVSPHTRTHHLNLSKCLRLFKKHANIIIMSQESLSPECAENIVSEAIQTTGTDATPREVLQESLQSADNATEARTILDEVSNRVDLADARALRRQIVINQMNRLFAEKILPRYTLGAQRSWHAVSGTRRHDYRGPRAV